MRLPNNSEGIKDEIGLTLPHILLGFSSLLAAQT